MSTHGLHITILSLKSYNQNLILGRYVIQLKRDPGRAPRLSTSFSGLGFRVRGIRAWGFCLRELGKIADTRPRTDGEEQEGNDHSCL